MKSSMQTIQIGDTFSTNDGGSVTVTNVVNYKNIGIRHNDHYGHNSVVRLEHLNNGNIKNPYLPNVFGIGYIGVGPYPITVNRIPTVAYKIWSGMLHRCYYNSRSMKNKSYSKTIVHPHWHNFQNFADWYVNHPFNYPGYQLDKDIIHNGSNCYSSHTCVLVPPAINILFIERNTISRIEQLPQGVSRNGDKFQATLNNIYIGTFETMEEASIAYRTRKYNYIHQLIQHYELGLCVDVCYAMYDLADTYL